MEKLDQNKPTAGVGYYKRHNAHSLPHAYFVWKGDKPLAGPMQEKAAKESCDAINAALAAERERLENDEVHRQQAVQEIYADKLDDLEAQLAAEREKLAEAQAAKVYLMIKLGFKDDELPHNALDAYVAEKVQALVDALKEVDEAIPRAAKLPLFVEIKEIAQTALAKVGK